MGEGGSGMRKDKEWLNKEPRNMEATLELKYTKHKDFVQNQLITYIGNKRSLIKHIEVEVQRIQNEIGSSKTINADLFSGSGVVARMLKEYSSKLIVNDMERYSEVINKCYLTNMNEFDKDGYGYHKKKIDFLIDNSIYKTDGIIANSYAPKDDSDIKEGERCFYTRENALIIDTIRNEIEDIPASMQKYFLAPLLYEASVKTNTSGVFKGFYKDSETGIGKFGGRKEQALNRIKGRIELQEPLLSHHSCEVEILRSDIHKAVKQVKNIHITYLDPPYNQHPYGSNYFMLNTITDNKLPEETSKVSGIPKDWNRSVFNVKAKALQALENVIKHLDSKYIVISYNSEGFIEYDEMINMLEAHGLVRVTGIDYNAFRGSRNLHKREMYVKEYLFTLKKHNY